ncbi:MAG: hypothetical protein WCI05_12550 [Myxococcales bacterium]
MTNEPMGRLRWLAAVMLLFQVPLLPGVAQAQEVSPKGKGIAGGALLGAEVVTMVESFIGIRKGWLYVVGAVVGAGGGGVGGYFVEQASSDGRAPVYMLAGGLALVIPALVLTLNATRYMPDEMATEDRAPTNAPPADPVVPSPPKTPQSLLNVNDRGLRLGMPVPSVFPTWSRATERTLGLRAETELRLGVFQAAF